ncbi:MAG TPA: hypothetical protein VK179_12750 [Bacteroidales bacterium]|nr:hypothetical protein [Bacteroidales bacterium]
MKVKENIRKFILNLVLLFLIVAAFDLLAGSLLRHYYFTQTTGLNYRTTYALDSTTADILVFGSSRANHHYVPGIFEDSLHMSFYNTGRDGNFLVFNYAVFLSVVKRYTPKMVIFDINPDEFLENKIDNDRLSTLLPYISNHPEFSQILARKGPYEKAKLLSSVYPYNSLLLTISQGNLNRNKLREGEEKGYIPIKGSLATDVLPDTANPPTGKIDAYKVDMMREIITYCSKHGILLYLVTSPVYKVMNKNSNMDVLKESIQNTSTVLLDYSNYPAFIKNPEFFKDKEHLNEPGSREFSALLAAEIKDAEKTLYLAPRPAGRPTKKLLLLSNH